jgi:hypothetical protein
MYYPRQIPTKYQRSKRVRNYLEPNAKEALAAIVGFAFYP